MKNMAMVFIVVEVLIAIHNMIAEQLNESVLAGLTLQFNRATISSY